MKHIEDVHINPGMLVRFEEPSANLSTYMSTVTALMLVMRICYDNSLNGYTLFCGDDTEVCIGRDLTVKRDSVFEVLGYTIDDGRQPYPGNITPSAADLRALVTGTGSTALKTIWARDEQYLELTVTDIEKKYGCKVKIVGEKKNDGAN